MPAQTQLPQAHIVHQAGERTRLRLPDCKSDLEFFANAERALKACNGVTYVETNPLTGSILVTHTTDRAYLAEYAEKVQLFTLQRPRAGARSMLSAVSKNVDEVNARVQQLSDGSFDLLELLFASLIGASLLQAARGNLFSPASSLLASAVAILSYYRARQNKHDK